MAIDYVVVECDHKLLKIAIDDIYYIHHHDGLTTFMLTQKEKICHKSLTELETLLPSNFIRISRNCIVNHWAITELNKKNRQISLSNGSRLTVSHRNIKFIADAIRNLACNA